MKLLSRALPLLLLTVAGALADPQVFCQKAVGDMACGPCSAYNAVAFGTGPLAGLAAKLPGSSPEEKVRGIVAAYGTKPSEAYSGKRPRYSAADGMPPRDFAAMLGDLLAAAGLPRPRADYLDVRGGESGSAHLRRVRDLLAGSLAAGLPPVVELRSYGAEPKASEADGFIWSHLKSHFLAVAEVGEIDAGGVGFPVRFADSWTGREIGAYVYAEKNRPFGAGRDFTPGPAGGDAKWEWLKGYPFLLVLVPDLPLGTGKEPWHARTTIVLAHAAWWPGK